MAAGERMLESIANRLLDLNGRIARENSTRNEEDTRQVEESIKKCKYETQNKFRRKQSKRMVPKQR